ncbi:GDYXXLXY domain-containing protein [Mesobacillus maritimus]|uniref:GDYXXLXY domain-containing protein n=1 Tax=Mesobacillus maritimus TaxID=1643336 RepID=UPI00203E6FC0|nr:GDYXXLXY domain-containing protein [Mesobacillus maritimus]MCM3585612.1 GDYXXLXY domain-containing protein [Mesobacillus maritimus]MCM3669084.1 GDYXXLXY domain-containing protein [Mesobacillus maritimus]
MPKRAQQLILACLIPVGILLGMTITPLYTLLVGEEVVLRTVPVDPTDLFRGDYVVLRYEAEELPSTLVDEDVLSQLDKGGDNLDVFVPLELQNGIHVPTKVSLTKPDTNLYLKGKLQYIGPSWTTDTAGVEVAHISYSLDKYFVEDNTGLELEDASRNGDILAKVKVKNGYAYLVDLSIEN